MNEVAKTSNADAKQLAKLEKRIEANPVEPGVLAFASVFHYAASFAVTKPYQRICIPQSKNPQQLTTDVGSLTTSEF